MIKALLLAFALAEPFQPIILSATDTGLDGDALSGAPTASVDMFDDGYTQQLSWTMDITPGTSTAIVVKCWESEENTTWAQVNVCDESAAAACLPDIRTYTFADYTAQSAHYIIASRWVTTKRYFRCSFTATGTGTIVLTGSRGY